jgi:alpha/beta superfamily hydrolase
VSRSEGEHAGGTGEVEDARAALDWLRARYPQLPYALAGFSFGSRIILDVGCMIGDAGRLIAVGFPTRAGYAARSLESCTVPKFFISSTHDEYAPVAELEAFVARVAEPKQLIWIEASDHFFAGALDQLEETIFGLPAPPRVS